MRRIFPAFAKLYYYSYVSNAAYTVTLGTLYLFPRLGATPCAKVNDVDYGCGSAIVVNPPLGTTYDLYGYGCVVGTSLSRTIPNRWLFLFIDNPNSSTANVSVEIQGVERVGFTVGAGRRAIIAISGGYADVAGKTVTITSDIVVQLCYIDAMPYIDFSKPPPPYVGLTLYAKDSSTGYVIPTSYVKYYIPAVDFSAFQLR